MSRAIHPGAREAEAMAEMDATRIGAGARFALVGLFLLACLAGATAEVARVARGGASRLLGEGAAGMPGFSELRELVRERGASAANRRVASALAALETRIGQESALADALRPAAQAWLTRALRYGNTQVLVGRDGWLFYQDELEAVVGPGFLEPRYLAARRAGRGPHPGGAPDPLPALADFAAQLARRGIALVVVPIPPKVSIEADHLRPRLADRRGRLRNPSIERFRRRLESEGIAVFDPTPGLVELAIAGTDPFLRADTHWSPAGMDRVARDLARFLRPRFGLADEPLGTFSRRAAAAQRAGDLARLLGLSGSGLLPETIELAAVRDPSGAPFAADRTPEAPVLLLGDSFSTVFARTPGVEGGAGFADQLSYHLGLPVASHAQEGAVGLQLVPSLAASRLASARVVIYELAERLLAIGDWPPVELPAVAAAPRSAVATGPRPVTVRVVRVAAIPDPARSPYADALLALEVELPPAAGGGRALLYGWAYRDRRLAPAAATRAGATQLWRLRPWGEVEGDLGATQRLELEGAEWRSLPVYWGEPQDETR
ncbi:MAG: hypothetical protein U0X73_02230 [Thermoanaerobaculia bacterium]